jgi:hypothetical protein
VAIPVLSGVGDALNYYQRNLLDPQRGNLLQTLNKFKMGLGLGDEGSQVIDQLPNNQVTNYAFQDNPLGHFAFDTATDPLTYLGTGLIPGAAKAIGLGGSALDALNIADKLPGQITGQALDAGGQMLGGPLKAAASTLEPYMSKFGDAHPDITKAWTNTNLGLKELNHGVPGYSVRNLFDDSARQAAFGDTRSAGDMLRGFVPAVKATFNGATDAAGIRAQQLSLAGQGTSDFIDAFGGDLPHSITDTGVSTVGPQSIFRKAQSSTPQLDPITGAPMADKYGSTIMQPTINGPKDWLLDKVSGWGELNKALEQNQELTTRGPVWGNAARELVGQYGNNMADYLSRNGMDSAAGLMADKGGYLSPTDLLDELTKSGVPSSQAMDVADSWSRGVDQVRSGADDWLNKTQFKYKTNPIGDAASQWEKNYGYNLHDLGLDPRTSSPEDLKRAMDVYGHAANPGAVSDYAKAMQDARAEQVLRTMAQNTFTGYKFGVQNVPTYLRLAGQHPGLVSAPADYGRVSDIYGAQHGLPSSFHGSMPIGKNPLTGDDMYFNPLALSSMGELVNDATNQSDDSGATGLGGLVHTLGDLSLGVSPIIKTALQLTGQSGNNQESDLLRPLTALSGAASLVSGQPVDLEQPFKNLVASGEQALTGRETYPYQDYLVRKQLADQSGGNNKWNATQTSGPQYDQAQHAVAMRQGVNNLVSTLSPINLQQQSPDAGLIGQRQYVSNYLGSRGLLKEAGANPSAQAYALADPLAEKVARFATLPIAERNALLRDPRALEMLQQQRMLQLHNPQALAAG